MIIKVPHYGASAWRLGFTWKVAMHKAVKWLLFTVLVGLIPVFCRLLVWTVTDKGFIDVISVGDIAIFGLVVQIAIINDVECFEDGTFKTIHNGFSAITITLYGVLFMIALLDQKIPVHANQFLYVTIALSAASLLLGANVIYRACSLQK